MRAILHPILLVFAGIAMLSAAWAADDYLPNGGGNGVMPFAPPSAVPIYPGGLGNMPGPPTQPGTPVRPESWPSGAPPQSAPHLPVYPAPGTNWPGSYGQPPAFGPSGMGMARPGMPGMMPPQPPAALAKPCHGAQTLGRVGTELILTGDLLTGLDELLTRKEKLSPQELEKRRKQLADEITAAINQMYGLDRESEERTDPRRQLGLPASQRMVGGVAVESPVFRLDPQGRKLIQSLLNQQIETRLICQDARRTIPSENLPKVEESLAKQFEQEDLKAILKRYGVESRGDLDRKLRAMGSSLELEKQACLRRSLAQGWIGQQIKPNEEVTHEQMLAWYQSHLSDFEHPPRARWEELMVRTAKYPAREDAYAAIAALGNQVLQRVPFAEVARRQSDGPTAADGGRRDWTTKGSLVSDELDRALFSLPLNQLSPIIEGKTGFHIIRVLERHDTTRAPFTTAQKEIREKIRQERMKNQLQEYLTRLQQKISVWTIFDEPSRKASTADRDGTRR